MTEARTAVVAELKLLRRTIPRLSDVPAAQQISRHQITALRNLVRWHKEAFKK